MVNSNLFVFMDKFLSKEKKNNIKQNVSIKILNRNLRVMECFKNLNLSIYNGKFFIPVFIDSNKINYMLGIFSFSYSIKLKKKIKIYKKKKKKKNRCYIP